MMVIEMFRSMPSHKAHQKLTRQRIVGHTARPYTAASRSDSSDPNARRSCRRIPSRIHASPANVCGYRSELVLRDDKIRSGLSLGYSF